MVKAYKYYSSNFAQSMQSYPYEGSTKDCRSNKSLGLLNITSYKLLKSNDPQAMIEALHKQPLAVAVATNNLFF